MILLIDNYDSFSYNLYQLVGSINPNIKVVRNDALTVDDVATLNPEAIILSPGPGKPKDAGICIPIIQELSGRIPLLGVCLGHQAIFKAFGGSSITQNTSCMESLPRSTLITLLLCSRDCRRLSKLHVIIPFPPRKRPFLRVCA